MNVGLLIVILFCLGIFGLVVIVITFPIMAAQKISRKLAQDEIRVPTERDREIQRDMKETRLAIMSLFDERTMATQNVVEVASMNDYLDKFDASKATRKQKPASRATPVVRSKRRRK